MQIQDIICQPDKSLVYKSKISGFFSRERMEGAGTTGIYSRSTFNQKFMRNFEAAIKKSFLGKFSKKCQKFGRELTQMT